MSSLCFVLGRGGSNGQVRIAMRASSNLLGICGCDMSLSISTPLMSCVSAREPPTLPSTLIRSNSTSLRSRSATCNTASTAICANCRCSLDTLYDRQDQFRAVNKGSGANILLPRLVMAVLSKFSVLVLLYSIVSAMRSRLFTAIAHARSKPSAIRMG